MAGSTNYPGALDSFGNVTDHVDVVDDDHINDLRRAIEAIETELGLNPPDVDDTVDAVASAADVALRLDHIANMLKAITGKANWYTDPDKTLANLAQISGITRRLFVPALTSFHGNATSWEIATLGAYRTAKLDAADEECYFTFKVPSDFDSNPSIILFFVPTAYWSWPSGSIYYDCDVNYSPAYGSAYNLYTFSKTSVGPVDVTGGLIQFKTLFTTVELSDMTQADMHVGVKFKLNSLSIITDIHILGLWFQYTSK